MSTVPTRGMRRGAILPFMIIVAVLVVAAVIYTSVWTNRLWFTSIGYSSVFTTMLIARIGLFVAFGLLMAAVVAANVAIAHRTRPRTRPAGQTSPVLERYRGILESRFTIVMVVLAGIAGLFAGSVATGQVQTYLAWRNSTPFGIDDPKFGIDVSFFVFGYPWWRFLLSFGFGTLVLSAIAAAIVHYVMGSIRLSSPRRGGTPAAQAHLSILVGLAVLLRAVQYWFDRYGLEIADQERFTGLHYTTDNATSDAKTILAVIAVLCAALFFANAVLRRWVVPTISLVLLVLSSIILGMVYPGIVQTFTVRPNEPDREREYIKRNIAATRSAYGVDDVKVTNYNAKTSVSAGQLREDASVLPSIRLMDPSKVGAAFEQLQQVKGYYQFPEILDIDRYQLDDSGDVTDTIIAAREIDMDGIQNPNWNALHTVYTHGHGLAAAHGSRAAPNGSPEWLAQDLPPTGELNQEQSRIYYGEMQDTYSVVGAKLDGNSLELDTPTGGEGGGPKYNTYDGNGGVDLNAWNRLLYAIKYFDANMLLSERARGGDTKILYDRNPRQRVQKVAPWLTVDGDAYPSVVDGRVKWIVDAYTTANSYPNSQRITLQDATSDTRTGTGTISTQPDTRINYMRNSVKAVVDAYDGSVDLYAWDENDPVLKTWQKTFPDTIKPKSEISAELMQHMRYPQDLYKVQREILSTYHVTDPGDWFFDNDAWEIPSDPTSDGDEKEPPYYLTVRMPDEQEGNFSLTSTYVPRGRQNIAAYMAVNSNPTSKDYGQFEILRVPAQTQIDGPGQAFNAMRTDSTVAEVLRPFLNQGSAEVQYGNLLTLPLGGGLIYVQPIYTQLAGSGGGQYPVLRFVMARFGSQVGIGSSLQEALDQVFEGDAGASTGEQQGSDDSGGDDGGQDNASGGGGGGAGADEARQKLSEASDAFEAADKAMKNGNLAGYQKQTEAARRAVRDALDALGE